jgi:hypothetical protein
MLCISDAQPPGGWGWVHRVSAGEIIAAFDVGWQVSPIEPAASTSAPAQARYEPGWLPSQDMTAAHAREDRDADR